MFKKLQAKLKNKKGFTLVELLIVIAVLGIIAAIAVPRFTGVLGGVKDKADVRAAELWAKEIEAEFMVENWTFPASNTIEIGGTTAFDDFNGTIPTSSTGNTATPVTLRAILTNTAATTGTNAAPRSVSLSIFVGTATTAIYTRDITLPID